MRGGYHHVEGHDDQSRRIQSGISMAPKLTEPSRSWRSLSITWAEMGKLIHHRDGNGLV